MIYYLYHHIGDDYFVESEIKHYSTIHTLIGLIRINKPIVIGNFYTLEYLCSTTV